MRIVRPFAVVLWAVVLSACSAMTTISSTEPGATVTIAKSTDSGLPRTSKFSTTSFGNFEFKAEAPGVEPFYGILPLKFNGGYLALDILFFAPLTMFNLREVYAFYEFDVPHKQLRYRQTADDSWTTYEPRQAEAERARNALNPPK